MNTRRQRTVGAKGRKSPTARHRSASAVLKKQLAQRTRELSEALEQQAATSEVLRVISSSPGDLEPVFQAMLANATRICEAKFGTINFYDGDQFRIVAEYNVPPAFTATSLRQGPFRFPMTRRRAIRELLLFRNSMTPGSLAAGRSCGSTAVATIMSQRSLKTTDIADLPSRVRAASV